ncbi:MAG: JAB domain-containing protein [Dehalococcoidia bacterium]
MQLRLDRSFHVQELEVRFRPGRKDPDPTAITSPNIAFELLRKHYANQPREQLICLSLNTRNQVIGLEIVSQGTADAAHASTREVFKAPIIINATAIILAHNHPSGDPQPSLEDRQTAKRLRQAGDIFDIKVLDFMIVTTKEYYSFAASEPDWQSSKGG